MGPPSEEIDGETIVIEALRRLEGKISATNAQIRVAKDFQGIRVDKTWATQALYNLVANALKFTRNGEPPDVEIASYQPDGSAQDVIGIAVRDRGPGVAPEHTERIFQLFQRAVGREVDWKRRGACDSAADCRAEWRQRRGKSARRGGARIYHYFGHARKSGRG